MTYKQHGPFLRDLSRLPNQLKKDIKHLEAKLKKLDRSTKKGRKKYNKLHSQLESKKNKANRIAPNWRKTRPELCQTGNMT